MNFYLVSGQTAATRVIRVGEYAHSKRGMGDIIWGKLWFILALFTSHYRLKDLSKYGEDRDLKYNCCINKTLRRIVIQVVGNSNFVFSIFINLNLGSFKVL